MWWCILADKWKTAFNNINPSMAAMLDALDWVDRVKNGTDLESVIAFGRYVFGKKAAKHHREWLEEALSGDRVAIQAPPESAKTTWMTIILMCWWIGKHPKDRNAIGSSGDDAASDMAQAVADTIENNPRWLDCFPTIVPYKEKGWSKDGYNVRDTSVSLEEWSRVNAGVKENTLTAGGVGSKRFNGIRITGLFVLDDIHDQHSMESDTTCRQTVDFVKNTAEPRVTKTGKLVIPQTRWNPKDVIAYARDLVRQNGTHLYKVFFHPALDEQGNSYWPEEWPEERLADTRIKVTEIVFQLVYMGNEQATQGQILKREALHWFPVAAILHTWTHYGGVDFAQKLQELTTREEARHSRFAYAMLAHSGTSLCLIDGYVGLIAMGESENVFFDLSGIYHPVRVGIEVNAQNRGYYNNLVRRKIEDGYSWLNLMPIQTTTNMGIRMSEMEPDFRLGAIQVSDGAKPFLAEFLAEWLGFGNKGVRDDTLSATHLARAAAYNLLPRENEQDRKERLLKKTVNKMAIIDKAYA